MGTEVLYMVQSLWPFAPSRNDDLRLSDQLVRELEIPGETKQFVFAIRDPESQALIYILCAHNLSQKSAIDAERLVRCVNPEAVVAQANHEVDFEDAHSLGVDCEHTIPTSSLEVLNRCFLHNISTYKYEDMAGSLVLKEIFGVEYNGHFSVAKRIAAEVGSSFLLLRSPFKPAASDKNITPVNIHPNNDYEPPEYARSVYPLLVDLGNIFLEIPSVGRALAYAQKMLHDVSKGETIDPQHISEVHVFRIAVEGLRIALNDAGRMPINKTKTEFSTLPDEDKSHALVAHVLRMQTKKFKSIVAILDARTFSGLRQQWNTTVLPSEVKDTIDLLVVESSKDEEPSMNDGDKKRSLTNKPVVAVGAGATAVLGASTLSKAVPASTFMKVIIFKVPTSIKLMMTQTQKLISMLIGKILGPTKVIFPGVKTTSSMKAAVSAEKLRTAVPYVIGSAEKTSFVASRASFYKLMRKRRVGRIGALPWVTFGCSVATCASLLVFGDGIKCVVESVPAAPSIASLGRGIESLHQASQVVQQMESSRIQQSINSLVNRFKKLKQAP